MVVRVGDAVDVKRLHKNHKLFWIFLLGLLPAGVGLSSGMVFRMLPAPSFGRRLLLVGVVSSLPSPPPWRSPHRGFLVLAVHLLAATFPVSRPSSCPSTRLRRFSSHVRQQRVNTGNLMRPAPACHCRYEPLVLLVSFLACVLPKWAIGCDSFKISLAPLWGHV